MWKSQIITKEIEMTNKLPPIHPGEILLEEFLEPMGISQYRLANDISVPPRRINEIVLGKRAITPDTALRLSLFFGLSERFWINLQTRYDIEMEKDRLEDRLEKEVHVYAMA
jgi:addiction module HigA family antidote